MAYVVTTEEEVANLRAEIKAAAARSRKTGGQYPVCRPGLQILVHLPLRRTKKGA